MRFFILSTIGRRLADARKEKGWSQEKLGVKVGTTQQTIGKIEKHSPESSKYYMPICEALGISYKWLMQGEQTVSGSDSNSIDPEFYIGASEEALEQAINSIKSYNLTKGVDVGDFDFDLLRKAFKIAIRGRITGDYITASLALQEKRKAM